MTQKRFVRFPTPRGFAAAHPKFWGADFAVIVRADSDAHYFEAGEYAVVDICGPLSQHESWPLDSYDAIRCRVECALTASQQKICLRINSPGGDFAGCVELGAELADMAKAAGKTLHAFTDSQCASAAYAIACACDSITITPSAFIGSIGVWSALVDTTAQDKMLGQSIKIIASGERKADRNPHVAITSAAINALQAQVYEMADQFINCVAKNRNISQDAVSGLEGVELLGKAAVNDGLADVVVNNWNEYIRHAAGNQESKMGNPSTARAALLAAAEGDDVDDKRLAKAFLAFVEKEEKKDEKALAKSEEDAKATSNDNKEDNSEEKEEDEKREMLKKKSKGAKAKAYDEEEGEDKDKKSAAQVQALAATVHALQTQIANEKIEHERAGLLASRPDFSAEVRSSLVSANIGFVRDACKNWPRVSSANAGVASAVVPGGTLGAGQTTAANAVDEEWMLSKMGGEFKGSGIRSNKGGTELELGYMSPKQIAEAAARLAKGGA